MQLKYKRILLSILSLHSCYAHLLQTDVCIYSNARHRMLQKEMMWRSIEIYYMISIRKLLIYNACFDFNAMDTPIHATVSLYRYQQKKCLVGIFRCTDQSVHFHCWHWFRKNLNSFLKHLCTITKNKMMTNLEQLSDSAEILTKLVLKKAWRQQK